MEINNGIKNRIKAIEAVEWKRKWNESSKLIWWEGSYEKGNIIKFTWINRANGTKRAITIIVIASNSVKVKASLLKFRANGLSWI